MWWAWHWPGSAPQPMQPPSRAMSIRHWAVVAVRTVDPWRSGLPSLKRSPVSWASQAMRWSTAGGTGPAPGISQRPAGSSPVSTPMSATTMTSALGRPPEPPRSLAPSAAPEVSRSKASARS